MNAILLVAHAPLAQAVRLAALHVFLDLQSQIAAVDILPQATPQESQNQVLQAWKSLQATAQATGTLVLIDVFGATPCNVVMSASQSMRNTRFLAGANLPMLLKALNHLYQPLDTLLKSAQTGGTQGILVPPSLYYSDNFAFTHD